MNTTTINDEEYFVEIPDDSQEIVQSIRFTDTFDPLPWQKESMLDFSPVKLLTGSAGGGKSRVAAETIHLYCMRYPGSTAVVGRKIERDVKRSSFKMLKRVVGRDKRVTFRASDGEIIYENGSTIYFVGMRNEAAREAIRSIGDGKVDIAWLEEAHELEEEDYEEILGRMRGASGGWNQVILTTNPNTPLHWIYRRLILNMEASVHLSKAIDNPHNHEDYLKTLDKLTGVKRKRLRDGQWVQATGMVIETWEDNWNVVDSTGGNVSEKAEYIPGGGDVWLLADDGYAGDYDQKAKMFTQKSHPRVFLLGQERSDGRLAIFYESYKVKMRKDDHLRILRRTMEENGWPWPTFAVHDSASPSLGAALRSHGIRQVFPGTKNLSDSIEVLRDACAPDENGERDLLVHPRCRLFRLEMNSWAFDRNGSPGKYFDNGPDCARYWLYHRIDPNYGETDIEVSSEFEQQMARLFGQIDDIYDQYMGNLRL